MSTRISGIRIERTGDETWKATVDAETTLPFDIPVGDVQGVSIHQPIGTFDLKGPDHEVLGAFADFVRGYARLKANQ